MSNSLIAIYESDNQKLAKRIAELEAENERLREELKVMAAQKGVACLKGHDLTHYLCCGHCLEGAVSRLGMALSYLEKIDEWQGRQMCTASVYEIEDDEFAILQCLIHEALDKIGGVGEADAEKGEE